MKSSKNASKGPVEGMTKSKSLGTVVKSKSDMSLNSGGTSSSAVLDSYAGYLQRKSRQHQNTWLKRFFKLDDGVLSYYHSAQTQNAAWEMALKDISRIVKSSEGYGKFDFTLEVHANDGTVLVLGSKDSNDLIAWLTRLNRVMNALWNQNLKAAMQIAKMKASRSNNNLADENASSGSLSAAPANHSANDTFEAQARQKFVAIKKSLSHKSELVKSASIVDLGAGSFRLANQLRPSESQLKLNSLDSLAQQQSRALGAHQAASSEDRLMILSQSDTNINWKANGFAGVVQQPASHKVAGSGSNLKTEIVDYRPVPVLGALVQSSKGNASSDSLPRSKSANVLPPTVFDPVNRLYIRPPPPPKLASLNSPVHTTSTAVLPSSVADLKTLVATDPLLQGSSNMAALSPPTFKVPQEPSSPDSTESPMRTLLPVEVSRAPVEYAGFKEIKVEYVEATTTEQLSEVMRSLQLLMSEICNPEGALTVLKVEDRVEQWTLSPADFSKDSFDKPRQSKLETKFKIRKSVLVPESVVTAGSRVNTSTTAATSPATQSTLSRTSILQSSAFILPTLIRLEHLVEDLMPFIEAECQCVLAAGFSKYQQEIFDRLTITVFECTKLARCIFRDSIYFTMNKDDGGSSATALDKQSAAYKAAYAVGKTARQLGVTGAEYFDSVQIQAEPGSPQDLKKQELLVSLDDLVNNLRHKLKVARELYRQSNNH